MTFDVTLDSIHDLMRTIHYSLIHYLLILCVE